MSPAEILAPLKALPDLPTMEQIITAVDAFAANLKGSTGTVAEVMKGQAADILKHRKVSAPARLITAALKSARAQDAHTSKKLPYEIGPAPWTCWVDGSEIAAKLEDTFIRYCYLPPFAQIALVLWTFYTHVMDAFDHNPFIALSSPTKRCGKTLVLRLLAAVVCRAMLVSDIRPSGIYRLVDEHAPTLLLDEADTYDEMDKEYRGILNSAHTRAGSSVTRTDKDERTGKFESKPFSTYAPIAIGLIGTLPSTITDRSIVIQMQRKTKPLPQVGQVLGDLYAEKSKLLKWAIQHRKALRATNPALPPGLDDRAQDLWRPLLAIAESIGGPWPSKARAAAFRLSGPEQRPETDTAVLLLAVIREEFGEGDRIGTTALLARLNHPDQGHRWTAWNRGTGLSDEQLAGLLEPFGIRPKQIRVGAKTLKGYLRDAFLDAWSRYLPVHVSGVSSIGGYIPALLVNSPKENPGGGGGSVGIPTFPQPVAETPETLPHGSHGDPTACAGVVHPQPCESAP